MIVNNNKSGASTNPKISVIIPLYNHEKYIKEAIYSILEQSFADFELIIINDGSTDSSGDIVKSINDKRIRYFYQDNQGTSKTINRGINLARGEYISILNSDDVYYTNRLEEVLNILEVDSSVNAVFTHVEFIDEEGKSTGFKKGAQDNWLGYDPETSFKENNNIILSLLPGNFLHTTSNLVCRKKVFNNIGYFSNLRYLHDYDFFLRLCYHHKVYVIKKPLLKYRFHSSNTLNEDYALADFETGLVLANFLLNYDLKKVFNNEDQKYDTMTKFFNSINTFDTDKIIMTLLLFGMKYCQGEKFFEVLNGDSDNPFRKACIDYLRKYYDKATMKREVLWQAGQTEIWWRKVEEFKKEISWQKEQTTLWWRKAEELKNELLSLEKVLKKKDESIEQLSEVKRLMDWVLPVGSRRKQWVKYLYRKIKHEKI